MIAQQGRVIAIEGDEAVVRIGGSSGCTVCDAGKGCGAGIFGRLLRRQPVSVHVANQIGAEVGQAVQLGIPESRYLALVLRLYAVPTGAAVLGALAGFALASRLGLGVLGGDLWTLGFAVLSAALALRWSRYRLGEFPLRSAVHLLFTAEPSRPAECGAGGTGRASPADELQTSKR